MTHLRASMMIAAAGLLAVTGCEDGAGPTVPGESDVAANAGGAAIPAPSCDATVTDGSSIQEAVNAVASGGRVCVESGTYTEQVVINKDLRLQGFGEPVIESPADPADFTIPESGPTWEPIVFAFGGNVSAGDVSGAATIDVDIQGFVVDGKERQPNVRRSVGIWFRNASGTVADNTVRDMGVEGRETMGILVYGDSDVHIARNEVSEYERGGIGANGDGGAHPAPRVVIEDNEVTGSTGIEVAWAPNGIQVGFGATGRITGNVVKDNRWAGEDWVASCILVFESDGVNVSGNEASNCDTGISVGAWAWFLPSADNVKIRDNFVDESSAAVVLQAVAWDGISKSDASVSLGQIVGNELTAGSIGDVGIAISAVDLDPDFEPVVENNKIIRNTITGFDTAIDDDGTASKKQVNATTP